MTVLRVNDAAGQVAVPVEPHIYPCHSPASLVKLTRAIWSGRSRERYGGYPVLPAEIEAEAESLHRIHRAPGRGLPGGNEIAVCVECGAVDHDAVRFVPDLSAVDLLSVASDRRNRSRAGRPDDRGRNRPVSCSLRPAPPQCLALPLELRHVSPGACA